MDGDEMSTLTIEKNTATTTRPALRQPERLSFDGSRPPLHGGDRLSRAQFERIYDLYPDLKAELIERVVYVSSPIRVRKHGVPHAQIMTWLGVYIAGTPGVVASDNTTLRLDLDNELQPDACLWIKDSGRAWENADDYLAGAPELIVEVAASSAAYDLHDKRRVYRRNGVQEYLVLLAYEQDVRWFNWQGGQDRLLEPGADGILRSQVFPGLWLDPQRFWVGDLAGVLAALQQGLDSAEHGKFAADLHKN